MSQHPYRQKTGSTAIYPTGDLLEEFERQESLPIVHPSILPYETFPAEPAPMNQPLAYPQFDNSTEILDGPQRNVSPVGFTGSNSSPDSSVTTFDSPAGSKVYRNLHAAHPSVSSTSSFQDHPSLPDMSQNVIQQYLGENAAQHLMPRMKTIDLYRKNAKKSNDPAVLFQYAQYMLQTALLVDQAPVNLSGLETPSKPPSVSTDDSASNSKNLKTDLLKEALHYLKKLSDKGYVDAQYLLGDAFSSGVFGKVDNSSAFNLFLAAAKRGHTECAFRTAHCYEEGLGTGRDSRKGIDFLKMAAAKNHPAAMYKLGIYFFNSRMGVQDTRVNKKLGIKWLERASNVATELTAAAPYELGKIYYTGYSDILIKDQKYALQLFAQAAALGNVEASAVLGRHYELGEVVPADSNLSIHYYTKAALGGHAESMLAMCAWYMVGAEPNLPKDEQEAFEWVKRAANCGHGKGQFVLANFYDKGIGCAKNTTESQQWYIKAAENGQEKALARINDKTLVAAITKKLNKKGVLKKSASGDLSAQEKDCSIV